MTLRTILATGLLLLTNTQSFTRPGTAASLDQKVLAVLNEDLNPAEHADSVISFTQKIIDLNDKINPDHSCHKGLFSLQHLEREEQDAMLTAIRIKKTSDLVLYDEAIKQANHLRFHYERAKILVEMQSPKKRSSFFGRLISKL